MPDRPRWAVARSAARGRAGSGPGRTTPVNNKGRHAGQHSRDGRSGRNRYGDQRLSTSVSSGPVAEPSITATSTGGRGRKRPSGHGSIGSRDRTGHSVQDPAHDRLGAPVLECPEPGAEASKSPPTHGPYCGRGGLDGGCVLHHHRAADPGPDRPDLPLSADEVGAISRRLGGWEAPAGDGTTTMAS